MSTPVGMFNWLYSRQADIQSDGVMSSPSYEEEEAGHFYILIKNKVCLCRKLSSKGVKLASSKLLAYGSVKVSWHGIACVSSLGIMMFQGMFNNLQIRCQIKSPRSPISALLIVKNKDKCLRKFWFTNQMNDFCTIRRDQCIWWQVGFWPIRVFL